MTRKAISLFVAIVLAGATIGSAQTTSELAGDQVLRALLDEIRALRLTIQRNAAADIRGRFLIERARMQQEVIREIAREVEAYNESNRMSSEIEPFEEMEKEMEARVTAATDPERKKMLALEKERMGKRREMQARQQEQMRQRQQRMENRLAEERDKLRVIEEELAQLQRELTTPPAR
ncbi:MAG: hypothetical protein JJE51_07235 [Thermoanaerobaculia bacterium]|nr:hypothetical protein [Thermoanaerobaculia bacterium]